MWCADVGVGRRSGVWGGMETEGVIKFEARHQGTSLREQDVPPTFEALLGWRSILFDTGGVGAHPHRYGGVGFGNVSMRVGARGAPRGARRFLVSGTQTSGIEHVGARDFAVVDTYDLRRGIVCSRGTVLPSSESLTHAAIYDHGPHIQCVLHVHEPSIWRARDALRLAVTPADVRYGTPEMAAAFADALRSGRGDVVVMAGHEDGVVVFGRSVEEAGVSLVSVLARARGLDHSQESAQ